MILFAPLRAEYHSVQDGIAPFIFVALQQNFVAPFPGPSVLQARYTAVESL